MLSKYSHISFDLDGTLLSTSMDYISGIISEIVEKLGGSIKNQDSIKRMWFENKRDKIIRKEFSVKPEDFWNIFREIETPEKRYAFTITHPDVEPAFKKLKEMQKTVTIITGCHFPTSQLKIDFDQKLCDMIFAIEYNKYSPKPDPRSFRHVMKEMKSRPEETLYIGNSIEDALFSQNAKVDFVHIERNEHPKDLKKYAVKVINSLEELFK